MTTAFVQLGGQLSFIEHDIPQHHFRTGFEFGRRVEHFRYQYVFHWCTVQERICCIIRIAFKIQLRNEPILSTCHLEMYVRGPDQVGTGRICPRLYRLEAIPTLRVACEDGGTIEVRIERSWIGIARMCVAAITVPKPPFPRGRDRPAPW